MAYSVKFQTETSYKNIKYGQGTVYSSGCGPASLCNALKTLGLADVSVPTMCSFAVKCGARVEGGTVISTLLQYVATKYGFEYKATSKNAELLAHLKTGGVAILHGGSSHKLFSSGGHFVTAVAASGETITILDSYWYSGKYTSTSLRKNNVTVLSKGVIQTSLYQCGLATVDRNPSYYLISKKVKNNSTTMEVEDMTEADVRTLIDKVAEEKTKKAVSNWAKDAFAEATKAGILDGTSPQAPLTREQFAVVLTKLHFCGEDTTPSSWASDAFTAATNAGVLDGTSPHGYVTREMLAQVLLNMGFLNTANEESNND